MTTRQTGAILRYLRSLVDSETTQHLSDAQLLRHFAARREEAAFAALMQRHAALVWGVCQHLLQHEQDAEDTFQATFLVLARRAGSIRKSEAVGSFLHGVAYRIALRLKKNAKRRHTRERQAVVPPTEQPPDDCAWRELQALLDEEVARLPAKYRSPFVLCCLEGKSRTEAAHELRCKEGTVSSRIARARSLLQQRLTQRGVSLSAVLCAGVLWTQTASATVPVLLVSNTVQAATGATGGFSAAVASLAEDALRAMGFSRWCFGGALILSISLLAAGVGVGRFAVVEVPEAAPREAPAHPPEARNDRYGDPLPPGALARLGTVRQRAPDSQLAVTADGKEIVAFGQDLTVRRFDAQTGALRSVRRLPGQHNLRLRYWLSPRGTFALTTGYERPGECYLDLWDLGEGRIRQNLYFSGHSPLGAAFSADERRVAVADSSNDRQAHHVLVWDLATSKSRVLWSEKRNVTSSIFDPVVVLSPDGKRLVACHYDQILRCWDVESEKLLWQSDRKIWSSLIFFSPDGRTVVAPSGVGTNSIDIRDAATGKMLEGDTPTPKEAVYPLGFSPNGRFLAFQTGLEEVVLWEPGKEKITFRFPPPPHRRDKINFIPNRMPTNFAFTSDSKGFIRRAGALQRWDLTTGKPVYPDTESWGHTEDVTRLVFSPDGRRLASSSKDQTVRLWDVSTKRTIHAIPRGLNDHLAFTPDGRSLLTVPYSILGKTALQATDISTGRPVRSFELADRREFTPGSRDKELRITADGKKIMMLTYKNERRNDESVLTAWDAATVECLIHKRVPWGDESLLTPDGQSVLAPNTMSGAIRLLDLETAKTHWQLNAQRPLGPLEHMPECGLALSPNGRLMAARRAFQNPATILLEYESVLLADMATGRLLAKLPADVPAVFDFSADNRLFAIAGTAGIRLWETATWKELGFIPISNRDARPQDRACASSLAFSPDGRILATGHADGTILFWDATLRGSEGGGQLTAAQRETLWNDLAGSDAAKAYAAIGRLADDLVASIPFLKERLKPVSPAPQDVLRPLLEDLDSDQFAVRETAQQKLRALGEPVSSSLRAELEAKPSLEKRKRIEEVLAGLDQSRPVSGEPLRGLRAVQVLERIGSVEARELLEALGRGVESARLTQATKEALTRLKKR
jgi:RNA polymerase sigma factor (sigma-70 family)